MKSLISVLFVLAFASACQNTKTADVSLKRAEVSHFLSERITYVNAKLKTDPNNTQLKAVRDYLIRRQSGLQSQ